jgi:hypothetical protein
MPVKKKEDKTVVISRSLASGHIPILLNAYRHGLYVMDIESPKISDLRKARYVGYHHETHNNRAVHILWLTPAGANFIENHFYDILSQTSLSYTYPIIKKGDVIEVIEEISNEFDQKTQVFKRIISGPSGSNVLRTGLYTVQSIDSTSVVVTDEVDVPYRLKLDKIRKKVRFVAEELGDAAQEKERRWGKIRVRSIVEKLQDRMNSLKMVELVNSLYEMNHTKDRIHNE